MKYRQGQVYVRKIHPKDVCFDLQGSFQLAYYRLKGIGYVMVRHGEPHYVIIAARSKRELKSCFVGGWKYAKEFFRKEFV
jgi:hypothetical protein